MTEKAAIARARRDAREGKTPSAQAGEHVREEFHHLRKGKQGARSPVRRAGVNLPPPGRRVSAILPQTHSSALISTPSEHSFAALQSVRSKGPVRSSAAVRNAVLARFGKPVEIL